MNILSTNNNQIFRKIEKSKSEKMETFRKKSKKPKIFYSKSKFRLRVLLSNQFTVVFSTIIGKNSWFWEQMHVPKHKSDDFRKIENLIVSDGYSDRHIFGLRGS